MQSHDENIFHLLSASTIIIFLSQLYLEQTSDFLLSIFGWIQLNILQWIISERFLFLGFYFLANFQVSLRLEKVLSHQTISEEPESPAEARWGEVSDYYLIQLSLWSQLAPALSLSLPLTQCSLLSSPILFCGTISDYWTLELRTLLGSNNTSVEIKFKIMGIKCIKLLQFPDHREGTSLLQQFDWLWLALLNTDSGPRSVLITNCHQNSLLDSPVCPAPLPASKNSEVYLWNIQIFL